MRAIDYLESYENRLDELTRSVGRDRAMELIVGGQYRTIGILEASLLRTIGLTDTDRIADIGCGSGRLAYELRETHRGYYLGTDLLKSALDYARARCQRSDWRFVPTTEPTIPADNGMIDIVCFFSVFTHLRDEDVYAFLKESKRVLAPNGRVVFSYLDYEVEAHWSVFTQSRTERGPKAILNRLTSKSVLRKMAEDIGYQVEQLTDGDVPWIKLTEDIQYEDGRVASGLAGFGQSIGVFRVPD